MKKLSFITVLLLCATVSFAQMGKFTQASSYLTSGKLDQAKKLVDESINHEKCINNPRAYFIRGQVYQAIFESKEFKKLDANALDKSWDAYQKVIELDEKNRYEPKLVIQYRNLVTDFTNLAIDNFNANKYQEAFVAFKRVLEIHNSDIMTSKAPAKVDTIIIFNTAIAAHRARNLSEAEIYFKESLKYNYEPSKCYSMLANVLKLQGKEQESLDYLHKGHELYPTDQYMLIELINYYLQDSTQTAKAEKYLDAAIKNSPNNAAYYRAKGTLYEKLQQKDKAREMYEKTLELDPKDFYSQFTLSSFKLDEVNEFTEKVNNISDIDEYNKELVKVYEAYKELVPEFEKALELSPDDRNVLQILKQLYFKLRDKDPEYMRKFEITNEKLKE